MKDWRVGTFDIGCENVDIMVRADLGGEFVTNPKSIMWIGIGTRDWSFVLQTLLHEAMEFVAFRTQSRFTMDGNHSIDHASYVFMFDHCKFADMCARVASFIVAATPVLREAWDAYHNPRKKCAGGQPRPKKR